MGKAVSPRRSERVSRIGSLAPDLWMIQATGKPVGPEALIEATAKALRDPQFVDVARRHLRFPTYLRV